MEEGIYDDPCRAPSANITAAYSTAQPQHNYDRIIYILGYDVTFSSVRIFIQYIFYIISIL